MPFTAEDFLDVFKQYNQAVFPLQILFNFIAVFCFLFIVANRKYSCRIYSAALAFLWLWIGIVYHLIFFSTINKAANIFGVLFIIQALLFFYFGVYKNKIEFVFEKNIYGITGLIFILYALLIYPAIGFLFGHVYPYQPTFGLPCPTTIFTFGMLMFASKKINKVLIIIPLIWSLIGSTAALNFGIYEDMGLLITGITGTFLLLRSVYRT